MRLRRLNPEYCLVKLAPTVEEMVTPAGLLVEHAITPAVGYGKVMQLGARASRYGITEGDVVAFSPSLCEVLEGLFPTPHVLIRGTAVDAIIPKKEHAA